MIRVRASTIEDADLLAPRLRPEDVAEVLAAGSSSPRDALVSGVLLSAICLTVEEDGVPQLMMGVTPSAEQSVGHPWLLSSDIITRHPRTFLARCRDWLDLFHSLYPTLTNAVDSRNTKHVRWLGWMGFDFIATMPGKGPGQHPFLLFSRTSHV